jgi:putative ABC transport system substrate-binding protein
LRQMRSSAPLKPLPKALGVTVMGAGVRDAADIESVLSDFAREPNGGLIVTPSPLTATRRDVIIATALRLNLPAIYSFRFYAASGGLISYGIDQLETVREAASYVIAFLRGENPRFTSTIANQISINNQSQDREGFRLEAVGIIPTACRRGD